MDERRKNERVITRRDTLRVCLVPAGVVATRFLGACSSSDGAAKNGNIGGQTSATGGAPGSGGVTSGITGGTSAGGGAPPSAAGATVTGSSGGAQPAGGATASGGSTATGAAGSSATSGGVTGAGGATSSGGATSMIDGGSIGGPGVPWATGGTKSIKGGYPDPFNGTSGASCPIYPAQTIGPCYAQNPLMRKDISDGLGGLPMRLSFLVVHQNACMAVPDASVDIWHAGSGGIYSAYATGTVCNPTTENVLMKTFCRGVQSTDADGRIDFDTVFPGWYKGRTIHVHFTVRVGGKTVTSQLYFPDMLSDEILAQGDYATRGKRDTNNTTDTLFLSGGATAAQVLFSTAKRPDGVLHAWKILSIG